MLFSFQDSFAISQTASLFYHRFFHLSILFFKFFEIFLTMLFPMNFALFCESFPIIANDFPFVNYFFKIFQNFFQDKNMQRIFIRFFLYYYII